MSALAAALLAEIDDDTLTTLADRLAPIVASRLRGDEMRHPGSMWKALLST